MEYEKRKGAVYSEACCPVKENTSYVWYDINEIRGGISHFLFDVIKIHIFDIISSKLEINYITLLIWCKSSKMKKA